MLSLKMAVYFGADEVYLGVKNFNARNIEGFNMETLKQAVDFAHIYNVKVHLAVNILFSDEEMQSALDLIVDAYNLGVDAFIVQDVGLISLLNKFYPEIVVHASTQMGIHNLEGVNFAKNLGVKRVVLARETSLEEVARIKQNSNIEIEYFAHGALCVSFSGNCYISSYLADASGNRGKCKQFCRLPYTLLDGGKEIASGYLLSAKDLDFSTNLNELKSAGVDAIKIEGRARRPFYVAAAVDNYRKLIDGQKADLTNLRLAFNRGSGQGYLNGNGDIISNRASHIGLEIGKVTKFVRGKKFNEVYFTSNRALNKLSAFKFVKNNQETTITAYDLTKLNNNQYKVTTTQSVKENSVVNLIVDNDIEQQVLSFKRKLPIQIKITAHENENISATFSLNGKSYTHVGEICEPAKTQPTTCKEIEQNFLKSEYFTPNLLIDAQNIFLPKQKLNEFRREVYNKIIELKTAKNFKKLQKIALKTAKNVKKLLNFAEIKNFSSNLPNFKNIIYSPEQYNLADIKNFYSLCVSQNKNSILNLPNFATHEDIEYLKQILNKVDISILVNNPYAFTFANKKYIGAGLNVYNNYSANYYNLPYLTAENQQNYKMPYMTLRHCPIKQFLNGDCANCKYSPNLKYKMQNGKILKLSRIKLKTCTFYLTD